MFFKDLEAMLFSINRFLLQISLFEKRTILCHAKFNVLSFDMALYMLLASVSEPLNKAWINFALQVHYLCLGQQGSTLTLGLSKVLSKVLYLVDKLRFCGIIFIFSFKNRFYYDPVTFYEFRAAFNLHVKLLQLRS